MRGRGEQRTRGRGSSSVCLEKSRSRGWRWFKKRREKKEKERESRPDEGRRSNGAFAPSSIDLPLRSVVLPTPLCVVATIVRFFSRNNVAGVPCDLPLRFRMTRRRRRRRNVIVVTLDFRLLPFLSFPSLMGGLQNLKEKLAFKARNLKSTLPKKKKGKKWNSAISTKR